MSLLLDGARLEVEDASGVLRLLRGELLPHLLHILRVYVVVYARAVPVALRVVQDGTDRVRHVYDPSSITAYNK